MEKTRLTVSIDKTIVKKLKHLAVTEEKTLSYYVENALHKLLEDKKEIKRKEN